MEVGLNLTPTVQNAARRILVACIGNIFLGDDGFGVEVAQQLRGHKFPEGVQVVDFGIQGIELAYALQEDYDTLVLVDAVPRKGTPGTLYLIEPDLSRINAQTGAEAGQIALDTHSMDPLKVLAYAQTLGARPIPTFLVGCEPAAIIGLEDYSEMEMGLSEPVQAAVPEAVKMIEALVARLLSKEPID